MVVAKLLVERVKEVVEVAVAEAKVSFERLNLKVVLRLVLFAVDHFRELIVNQQQNSRISLTHDHRIITTSST